MKKRVKNYGKSIRTKLLHLKNTSKHQYMYLLSRYFSERLLYRVSVSKYNSNFILKGGSLLYAMDGLEARPTVDIDIPFADVMRIISEQLKDIMNDYWKLHPYE